MKRRILTGLLTCMFFCLLGTARVAADSIPYFALDKTFYAVGETITAVLYNFDKSQETIHAEILWKDKGCVVFASTVETNTLTINTDNMALHPGSYIMRIYQGTEILSKQFSITGSGDGLYLLTGTPFLDETGNIVGVWLEWNGGSDETCTITRSGGEGNITMEAVGVDNFIDVNIQPNSQYTYTVACDSAVSNGIVIDLAGFVPASYTEGQEKGVITLTEGSSLMLVNRGGKQERTQIDANDSSVIPVNVNGRVLLPIRSVVEEMGGKADWDGELRRVTLNDSAETNQIIIPIGETTIYVNGSERTFDVPARIENGRTLVPIRHVEALGCGVYWKTEKRAVVICYAITSAQ